jgi:hypothetical protein
VPERRAGQSDDVGSLGKLRPERHVPAPRAPFCGGPAVPPCVFICSAYTFFGIPFRAAKFLVRVLVDEKASLAISVLANLQLFGISQKRHYQRIQQHFVGNGNAAVQKVHAKRALSNDLEAQALTLTRPASTPHERATARVPSSERCILWRG